MGEVPMYTVGCGGRSKTIYLAGKLTDREWAESCAERNHARMMLAEAGFNVLCPTRGKAIASDHVLSVEAGDGCASMTDREIVMRDVLDVESADYVLVLTGDDREMNGTIMEWGIAFYLGKPVFVVAREPERLGLWRRETATRVFGSVEEAVDHMAAHWA